VPFSGLHGLDALRPSVGFGQTARGDRAAGAGGPGRGGGRAQGLSSYEAPTDKAVPIPLRPKRCTLVDAKLKRCAGEGGRLTAAAGGSRMQGRSFR
jgi:hypothetical protein